MQKFHYITISDKSQLSDPWKFAYNLKMVLLIYSAFVLFLCSLPETTKTCRKTEPGSLTPYHLICWQIMVSGSTYRSMKGLFLGPKRKKEQKKKGILCKGVSSLQCELGMQKPRVKHIYLANYILPTFWGWCGWSIGRYSGRSGKKTILAGW